MTQFIAVTPQQFANKSWKRYPDYSFAAQANILPVAAAELSRLVPVMPLGFVQAGDAFQLVAITALRPGQNLFVAPDGRWMGDYVPAALRGYPFRLVKPQGRESSILCFDESSGLLADAGEAESFFDETGAPSQVVKDILGFLSQVERNLSVTQVAVDALQAAGLIQSWALSLQQGGQQAPVEGVFRIDEAALNALPDEAFVSLRKTSALPVAYAQLLSMSQLAALQKNAETQARLREQLKAQEPGQSRNTAGLDFAFSNNEILKFH